MPKTSGATSGAPVSTPPVDILLALHACDTATDDAIYFGIRSNASIIVVAPCCHKQLRPQLDAYANKLQKQQVLPNCVFDDGVERPTETGTALKEILTHGIYRERQAEMVTDSLRALYLQYAGYDTKVFEFVSGTHTPKNVMITAVRRTQPLSIDDSVMLLVRIERLKSQFGICKHKLEDLLRIGS